MNTIFASPVTRQIETETKYSSPKAGFIKIDPIKHSLKPSYSKKWSHTQQMFYSFYPATSKPVNAPLFVYINGGPGCATTTNLFAYNTAPYTLDMRRTNGSAFAPNAHSWTKLGNLLYIDAPNAGYSYVQGDIIDIISDPIADGHYNPFIDADQVLRAVFLFLSDFSDIKRNPVVFVGESYSGTRVSTMLNLLYNHPAYTNGTRQFNDPGLSQILQSHFKSKTVTTDMVRKQFGRQVLIQPQLTGPYQNNETYNLLLPKGSPIDVLAGDAAKWDRRTCKLKVWIFKVEVDPITCLTQKYLPRVLNRDPYVVTEKASFSDDMEAFALNALTHASNLSTLLGVDVKQMPRLRESDRGSSFRYWFALSNINSTKTLKGPWNLLDNVGKAIFGSLVEKELYIEGKIKKDKDSLSHVLGKLNFYDTYIVGTNKFVYLAYRNLDDKINQDKGTIYGELFLENLPFVKTFLTNAKQDYIIYSPAIPASLKLYKSVHDVKVVEGNNSTAGAMTITYNVGKTVTIHYPSYEQAGHSVSTMEPAKFMSDVEKWMKL